MAESLARPWILKHLLGIAETRGANIHDAPPLKEKRKVQITRFLTFPSNDRPNDIIWALISDKQYEITAKFTASAVTAYNRENDVFGAAEDERRLTTRRFSLAIISDIKAFFARVPLGNDKGMSDTETIVLEVGEIRILGADHEGIFGNPANIEVHEDLQEWIFGLKQGGGGGNILKRSKETAADAEMSPIQRQIVLPSEKQVAVMEAARQPIADPKPECTSPGKGDRQVNLLKEWKRKWKTLNIMQFPPEVQPILDQILGRFCHAPPPVRRAGSDGSCKQFLDTWYVAPAVFGQEARENSAQGEACFGRSNEEGDGDIDQGELIRQEPAKSRPVGSQSYSIDAHGKGVLHTPASSHLGRSEDVGSQRQEPSTPSVWENSEDERQMAKRKRWKENEGASVGSTRALLPTPRHTRSPNSTPERDENALERDKDDAGDVTAFNDEGEGPKDSNGDDDHSDHNRDGTENSFSAPTPAQRPRRNIGTIPSASPKRDPPSPLDTSQNRDSYAQPRMPVSVFPYHSALNRAISSHNAHSNFETSQPESCAQSESQHKPPQYSQSQHMADSSSQKLESDAPRILVPDSDTSVQINSQSQSQSQLQSQSQSRHFLQSQCDSQSRSQTRPASTYSKAQQVHSPHGSMRSPLPTAAPQKQSAVPADGERRVPLLSSRSVNQSQQKPQSLDGQANKKRVARKSSSQDAQLPSSMTESQAQSQPRSHDIGTTMTSDSALATLAEASSMSTRGSLPQLGGAVQDQHRSSSTTQEDSQTSHTEMGSFNSKKTSRADAQTVAKAESSAPLDTDDVRTHGLLFGKSDHPGESGAIRRGEPKCSVRETYRLSHVQGSPTMHLGKHRRSSTSSLRSMASAASINEGNVCAQKKMRVSIANSEPPIVHREAVHDSEAWKAPTFLRLRRLETEGAQNTVARSDNNEQQARNSTTSKGKEKQAAEAVFAHQDAVAAGQSHNSTQNSASASITKSSSISSQDAGISGRAAGGSKPSQAICNQTTTQTSTSSKSKKRKRNTSQIISSAASSSQVKVEDMNDNYPDNDLLDGFTSDLTLHRIPGGPKWLNWNDALRILSRLNKRDFPSQ